MPTSIAVNSNRIHGMGTLPSLHHGEFAILKNESNPVIPNSCAMVALLKGMIISYLYPSFIKHEMNGKSRKMVQIK